MNKLIITSNRFPVHVPQENIEAYDKLSIGDKPFIEAALQLSISKYESRNNCTDEMMEAVAYVFAISGQKSDAQDLLLHTNEAYDWLMRTYPYVTVQEFKDAMKRGIYGEYGDYFGLNARSFVGFVKSYFESAERKRAKEAFENAKLSAPSPKVSLTEDDYKRWIIRDLKLLDEGEAHRILYSKGKYYLLRRLRYIEFTSIDKWKIWLYKAKREQVYIAKSLKDKSMERHFMEVLSEFERSGTIYKSDIHLIVIQARNMIYLKFLSIISEFGYKDIFNEVETDVHKIS